MTTPIRTVPRNLPGPYSEAAVIKRLLMVAASQIGYREGRSSSGSWNNDNAFGKWYGTNGVAWCAQFVSWASFVAGVPATVIPKHQYTPTGWNWFVKQNRDVGTPRAGDIFYVYGYVSAEKRSRVHHVGIVEKVLSGGRIQTIEGNTNNTGSAQGNGVYRLIRPVTSRLRFARPNYAKAVKKAPPAAGGGSGSTRPSVSLKACVYHAQRGSGQYLPGTVKQVQMVKERLVALKMGTASNSFRTCYAAWQRHLGYTGSDADGIPGKQSLTILANNSGWVVVA